LLLDKGKQVKKRHKGKLRENIFQQTGKIPVTTAVTGISGGPSDWIRTSGLLNPIQFGKWEASRGRCCLSIDNAGLFFLYLEHKQKNWDFGAYFLLMPLNDVSTITQ